MSRPQLSTKTPALIPRLKVVCLEMYFDLLAEPFHGHLIPELEGMLALLKERRKEIVYPKKEGARRAYSHDHDRKNSVSRIPRKVRTEETDQ